MPNGIYPYLYQITEAECQFIPLGSAELVWDGITYTIGVFVTHSLSCRLGWRNWGCGALSVMDVPTANVSRCEQRSSDVTSGFLLLDLALPGLDQIDSLIDRPAAHRLGQRIEALLHLADARDLRPIRIARCLQDVLDATGAIEPSLDLRPFLRHTWLNALSSAGTSLTLTCRRTAARTP